MRDDSTMGTSVPVAANSIYGPHQQWPPPVRLVTREGEVALAVPEIVSLVQEGIITAGQAAELLGFKP